MRVRLIGLAAGDAARLLSAVPEAELVQEGAAAGADVCLAGCSDLALASALAARAPQGEALVLVVPDAARHEAVDAALAVGARGLAGLSIAPERIAEIVRSAAARRDREARTGPSGRVIGVIGAAGGVGATTAALRLAHALAGPLALVDLDPCGGALASMLGAAAADGPGLAGADDGREAAFRLLEPAPFGAFVPAPAPAQLAWTVRAGVAAELIEAVAGAHRSVVVDLGRCVGPALEAIRLLDAAVIVGHASRRGRAAAAERLHGLARIGLDVDRTLVCAPRAGLRERALSALPAESRDPAWLLLADDRPLDVGQDAPATRRLAAAVERLLGEARS